ncbi:MAG: prepilin-type N-terminal cleavage/methylation domain-containing protein [Bythopirellula sp.]|nr:prepilin-type N-terminal cleavage/methylation domain-containing protein [Bythopirellula sp.]
MCIHRAGFRLGLSLLELMLVVVLVSIIASVVIARVSQSTDTAKCKACRHNRIELNGAIERYGVSNGSFPSDLSDLAVPDYFPQGIPVCPVSGSAYSMNSTTHRIDGHTLNSVPGDH